ncbi:hypothetical protein JX265_002314 [Neoarthrinium moseri]|uniref:DUF7791 domain-containing protein n=1 Tax=Neoarthrinium moseri TaxID=1658444 RepID=A0A9P9WU07_9PEZI|nr:hypothetical protein JX265_002314 [Neoarthrinium moseri]
MAEPAPPTIPFLKQAFLKLLEALGGKARVCLFMDGLDEYAREHLDMINLFRSCARLPHVKLCLSSRPLTVFEQAFSALPGMKLQNFTKGDIRHYVKSNLYGHPHMEQLSRRYPKDGPQLLNEIVEKSMGVFLWVKIVVRSLLQGLCDFNRISDLKKRVPYLPEDLEALYAHILRNIDPLYHAQASKIFQIVRLAQRHSSDRVTLLNLSWADDEDDEWAEAAPMQPLPEDDISFRCETTDARLKSACAGLLESNDVRFSDLRRDVWDGLISRTSGTGFSPHLAMLKSSVLHLKALDTSFRLPRHATEDTEHCLSSLDMRIIAEALQYAPVAEDDLGVEFPGLLDQLDIVASQQWFVWNKSAMHWSYGIDLPGIKPIGKASTFYEVAKCMGLEHYTSLKYETAEIVDQQVNQHLPMQSIPFISRVGNPQTYCPDLEQMRYALRNGTSPNLTPSRITP